MIAVAEATASMIKMSACRFCRRLGRILAFSLESLCQPSQLTARVD